MEKNPVKAGHVSFAITLSALENAANSERHRQRAAEAAIYLGQLLHGAMTHSRREIHREYSAQDLVFGIK